MRRGNLVLFGAIVIGCGGRTDMFEDPDGAWTQSRGGAVSATDAGEDSVGGYVASRGGAGGAWTVPPPISGGITWVYPTSVPSSGSVPVTRLRTVGRGGATPFSGGGTTWIATYGGRRPIPMGGYSGIPSYVGGGGAGGIIGRGGAAPFGGYVGRGGTNPYGGSIVGRGGASPGGGSLGKGGMPPQLGGFAGVYLTLGGYVGRGGAGTTGGYSTGGAAIGGWPATGGSNGIGGTSGILGLLVQACSGAAQNECQQCLCQFCTQAAVDCAGDSGCTRLVECAARNACSDANCFIFGPCSSLVSAVGGLDSAAVRFAVSLALCPINNRCKC